MTISSCGEAPVEDSNTEEETQVEDYSEELIHGYWLNEDGVLYLHFEEDGDFTYNEREVYVEGWFDLDDKYLILGFNDGSSYTGEYNSEEDTMAFLGLSGTFYRATEDMLPEQVDQQEESEYDEDYQYAFDTGMVGVWENGNDVVVEFDEYGGYVIDTPVSSQYGTYMIDDTLLTMYDYTGSDIDAEYDPSDDTFKLEEFGWFYRTVGDDSYDSNSEVGAEVAIVGTWESLVSDSMVTFYEDGSFDFQYSEGDSVTGTFMYYFSDDSFMLEADKNGYDFSGGYYDPSDDTVYLDGWEWFVRLEE